MRTLVVAGMLMLAFAIPSAAAADTGTVTRAESNATWTLGSFAGNVDWTSCAASCGWIPIATVQPALPAYRCLGDEALDNDPNTRVVWNGGGRTSNSAAPFDVADVPILTGVYGQRLCLSVIETISLRDPVCVAQAPILGMDPNACPFIKRIVGHVLVDKGIAVAVPPPAPTPEPAVSTPIPAPAATPAPAAPTPTPAATAAPVNLTASRAKSAASAALKTRYGWSWRQRTRASLSCSKRSDGYTCRAKWRHGRKRYTASVTVRVTDGKVRARIVRQ